MKRFLVAIAMLVPLLMGVNAGPRSGMNIERGIIFDVLFCGNLANNAAIFTSPAQGGGQAPSYDYGAAADSWQIAGDGCDAQSDLTEGDADEAIWTNNAAKTLGMFCVATSSGSNGVVFRIRSAAASLTPDVTCTVATTANTCATNTASTVNIAAGATLAVSAVTTEDLSAQAFWCIARFEIIP